MTVAGKPQAQSVLLAPGYCHPEGSLCQSRQRIDATHRFPIKFHDLPGCFSLRHRWNVDGEHMAGVQTGLCALQFDQPGKSTYLPQQAVRTMRRSALPQRSVGADTESQRQRYCDPQGRNTRQGTYGNLQVVKEGHLGSPVEFFGSLAVCWGKWDCRERSALER